MLFISFIVKNLRRRWFRSLLTLIGVAVAVGAVIALVGIADNYRRSTIDRYAGRNVDLVVSKAGIAERLTSSLDENLAGDIAKIEGVRDVDPVLMDIVSIEMGGEFQPIALAGWKPGGFMFEAAKLEDGRAIESSDTPEVMLGAIIARNMGKKAGDTLDIVDGETFNVVGVFQSFSLAENSMLVVSLAQLQRLMDRGGQATNFNVRTLTPGDEAQLESIRAAIEKLPGGLSAKKTQEFVATDMQIRMIDAMAWLTSTIALVIGTVGVLNTMVMSVYERTQEIGILRAIGWRKPRVIRMILAESLTLSVLGAVAGALAAAFFAVAISRLPAGGGVVTGDISPVVFAQGFLMAIVVGLIGGAYPAFRGAQLLPTEALRHD